jgi:hypothetical protein
MTLALALQAQVSQGAVVQSAADVTFALLATRPQVSTYQVEQTRRFLDERQNLVQIVERLTARGNGTAATPFQLEFIRVLNETDPAVISKWHKTYLDNAGLLHLHGGFRVHNVACAQRNYTIHDFGVTQRIGRTARRVVVFPNRVDKSIWVLDVDVMTGLTVYSAEFDSTANLLGEIEITSMTPPGKVPAPTVGWAWAPRMAVQDFPSAEAAGAALRAGTPVSPRLATLMPEYVLNRVHLSEDGSNGDQSLVMTYTDGVDVFFVSESFGARNPFELSPALGFGSTRGKHTIASYDDPVLRVYLFHENKVNFQIVGRGGLTRLRDVALGLCRQVAVGK